jgi:hypothetical protein
LVVEGDGCGEAEEALEDALAEAGEGAGAVALEGEDVLAGPEDTLDALTDRREVWPSARLVLATGRMIAASMSLTWLANSRPA